MFYLKECKKVYAVLSPTRSWSDIVHEKAGAGIQSCSESLLEPQSVAWVP